MASSDFFVKVGNPGTATTLTSPGHSAGGTVFKVGSTANWPATAIFAIDSYTVDTTGKQVRVPNTYTEWEADVTDSTTLSNAVIRYGNDQDYTTTNTRVYIPVAASRENRLIDGLLTTFKQDGTLNNVVATSITSAGQIAGSNGLSISGGTVALPPNSLSANSLQAGTLNKLLQEAKANRNSGSSATIVPYNGFPGPYNFAVTAGKKYRIALHEPNVSVSGNPGNVLIYPTINGTIVGTLTLALTVTGFQFGFDSFTYWTADTTGTIALTMQYNSLGGNASFQFGGSTQQVAQLTVDEVA